MKKLLFLTALAAIPMLAASGPCPTSTGVSTGAAYTAAGGLCNVVITFGAGGGVSTSVPNANPYDGSDDTLVGIVNNSGATLIHFNLSSSLALFGFDGDGACAGTYETAGNCTGHVDTNNYGGPGVLYSAINGATTSGTVNLGCTSSALSSCVGIASGATAWFSLEQPPSLNIAVNTPEPGSILLFGTCLSACAFFLRRKIKNN
jgi:hypothetical protein